MFTLGNVQSGIDAGWTGWWRQCRLDWMLPNAAMGLTSSAVAVMRPRTFLL